jgi:hypothetical protein
LNVGRTHYFACHACKRYWRVGSNLFSSWQDEDEATWKNNAELLSGYADQDKEGAAA